MRKILFAFALVMGCGGESGSKVEILPDGVEEPPPGGVQIVSPTFEVAATTEVFMCMRIPFEVTGDLYVQASKAWQVTGGHHAMPCSTNDQCGPDAVCTDENETGPKGCVPASCVADDVDAGADA
jgi:hypothetical protein